MFTGIIEELGSIERVDRSTDAARLTFRAPLVVQDARHGDSISVSGVCLTVVDRTAAGFTADVMAQTLAMSTLDGLAEGTPVNLERAALVGDRLGGEAEPQDPPGVAGGDPEHAAGAVDVALHDVSAKAVADQGGAFEVDRRALGQAVER